MGIWKAEYAVEANTTVDIIWDLWTDIENWKDWSHDLASSSLTGTFAAGTKGQLQIKQGPLLEIQLVEVSAPNFFADETALPDGVIRTEHEASEQDGKVLVTYRVIVTGSMAGQLGPRLVHDVPANIHNFITLAEQRYKPITA